MDARFLNLWMRDAPFSLDKLSSFMTKCDDKFGYERGLLSEASKSYFGFSFGGLWFVCTTLPFGWKIPAFVYHTIRLSASGFLRSKGIPCSLYIDDRLNGELLTSCGPWSVPPEKRSANFRLSAARGALFVVLSVLVELGYTIGIKKSVLCPTTSLEYLGFIVDSTKQSLLIPERTIESFARLRVIILGGKSSTAPLKSLQRFQGKCISFSLAVPAAKLFIRDVSRAISLVNYDGMVSLSKIAHWRFLDNWEQCLPCRDEKNHSLTLSTDASRHGWGCVIHFPLGDQALGDYWYSDQLSLFISSKEMLALVYAIKALLGAIHNCRIDARVDSKVVIDVWGGQGCKSSSQLTSVTKQLFFELASRNIQLNLLYVPSGENLADDPSRRLSRCDSALSSFFRRYRTF